MTGAHGPRYDYSVTLHDNFTNLLRGAESERLTDESVVRIASERGRAILQARGGAGKTVTLERLAGAAEQQGLRAQMVDLSHFSTEFQSDGATDVWLQDIAERYARRPLLICIDNLDAIPPDSGQRVLGAVERLTSLDSSCSVIISDRMGRRPLREERWALLGLSTVRDAPVTPGVKANPPWLASPLYLHLLKPGFSAKSPAALLHDSLAVALRDDEAALDRLGAAVLGRRSGSPHDPNPRTDIADAIGDIALGRLEGAGLVENAEDGSLRFSHHLLSSYLATRAAARDPHLWRRQLFEFLTTEGATFEPLGLLLEQVPADLVDDFVKRVDDWNFYASAHLIIEDSKADNRVGRPLRDALLLLLGRRKLAQLPSTRRQVEDALLLHGGELSSEILSAGDESALVQIAHSLDHLESTWWHEWLHLFSLTPSGEATGAQIMALSSSDGVLGWTAANTLVTARLTAEQRCSVVDIASADSSAVARWRAVHVIGGQSDSESAEVCLRIFRNDDSTWVRYGALRSFVAVVSRLDDANRRAGFFLELSEDTVAIQSNARWKREIERSVLLDERPVDWPSSVGLLLERLWAASDSVEEQDRWRRLSTRLRTGWQGGPIL